MLHVCMYICQCEHLGVYVNLIIQGQPLVLLSSTEITSSFYLKIIPLANNPAKPQLQHDGISVLRFLLPVSERH